MAIHTVRAGDWVTVYDENKSVVLVDRVCKSLKRTIVVGSFFRHTFNRDGSCMKRGGQRDGKHLRFRPATPEEIAAAHNFKASHGLSAFEIIRKAKPPIQPA